MKKILLGLICLILSLSILIKPQNLYTVSADNNLEGINSKSYILLDYNSGEVLNKKDIDKKMPVASICKLMTSLLTLDNIENKKLNIDDKVIASDYACSMDGSQAFLDADCEYKIYDLLKSVIIASANDSSVVLAEAIAGSEKEFVNLMNKKAKELKMTNTFYENSNGLPTPNQHSTAYDTSLLLKEISKYNLYNELSNIWMDELIHPSGRKTDLVNTNRLIKYYPYCLNGKTGFTDEAGYCLASSAEKDGLKLLAVVLNSNNAATRFSDSIKLFNYGFNNYENKQILFKNKSLNEMLKVKNSDVKMADIGVKNDFYVLNKKGEEDDISIKFDLPNNIKAPLKKNDFVGKCKIIKNGKIIGEENIVVLKNIDAYKFSDILEKISLEWRII